MRSLVLTSLALVAFAGNSVLNRLALAQGAIDPLGFTAVRLIAGCLALLPFLGPWSKGLKPKLIAPLALCSYAICFSLSYLSLPTGTGALILFAFVQLSMITIGLFRGMRPRSIQWLGLALSIAGLIGLVGLGLTRPDPIGALLMAVAGTSWGVYSLAGRGTPEPTRATALNFLWAAPVGLALLPLRAADAPFSSEGLLLAVASGALTSGMGYAIWYAALKHLETMTAAVAQLSVPVIAALGGVLFVGEPLTLRFLLASACILGGILLVVRAPSRSPRPEGVSSR